MGFEFVPEYKLAIDAIKSKQCVFLSGPAGSGKSTFIRYIQSRVANTILLAPTGVAAINVRGQTIHSFFKFPAKFIQEKDIKILSQEKRNQLKKCPLLIVDEISMASANIVDAFDLSLRKNRGIDKPFGGMHVLFVGDLYQLSPVVTPDVESIFYSEYLHSMFFASHVVNELIDEDLFEVVKLKTVKRQNDPIFIDVLNKIRIKKDVEEAIDVINDSVQYSKKPKSGYIQITPYKDVCDITNDRMLNAIDSPAKTYFGTVDGTFHESNFPVNQATTLKVGAQVMVCRNLSETIVNGTIATVTRMENDFVVVDTKDEKGVIIKPCSWQQYGYTDVGTRYIATTIGSYTQIPLKAAWSITIHKIQSATIEKLYIDMDRGAFSPGMLYVALSRATSLQGIMLSSPLVYDDVMIDEAVNEFYNVF